MWNGWQFNVAYQYQFAFEEEVARSDIVGGDFANSEFRAQAHWLSLSWLKQF